jgi:hypothetical protein
VNGRHAATHVGLYRRARHRSVRAKHAAIAGKGLEPFAAPFAIIEELTGIGRHRLDQMPNYTRMLHFPFDSEEKALQAEAAIEKLEYAIGHSKSDPEYSDSLQRNMLVWNQWPSETQAGATGREG